MRLMRIGKGFFVAANSEIFLTQYNLDMVWFPIIRVKI